MLANAVAVAERCRHEAMTITGRTSSVRMESCPSVDSRWMSCSVSIVDVREKRQADREADRCPGEEEFVRRWEHFELAGPLGVGR